MYTLLDNMTDLVDFVMPFVGDGEEWKDDVDNLLDGIYNLVKQNKSTPRKSNSATSKESKSAISSPDLLPSESHSSMSPVSAWGTVSTPFKVIVPQSARIALSDDVLESIVRKSELIYAFGEIFYFRPKAIARCRQ